MNPLLGFRFMEVFLEVLEEYLGEVRIRPPSSSLLSFLTDPRRPLCSQVSESSLKENFDIVYEVRSLPPFPACFLLPSRAHASLPSPPRQLLEEMLDEGSPLTTQSNILRDIVLPPTLLNKVLSVAGVSGFVSSLFFIRRRGLTCSRPFDSLGPPSLHQPFSSPIPWRRPGVKHISNEVFFDFVESLDVVLDR